MESIKLGLFQKCSLPLKNSKKITGGDYTGAGAFSGGPSGSSISASWSDDCSDGSGGTVYDDYEYTTDAIVPDKGGYQS